MIKSPCITFYSIHCNQSLPTRILDSKSTCSIEREHLLIKMTIFSEEQTNKINRLILEAPKPYIDKITLLGNKISSLENLIKNSATFILNWINLFKPKSDANIEDIKAASDFGKSVSNQIKKHNNVVIFGLKESNQNNQVDKIYNGISEVDKLFTKINIPTSIKRNRVFRTKSKNGFNKPSII